LKTLMIKIVSQPKFFHYPPKKLWLRKLFEADYTDKKTGVVVHPLFVQTGKLV